MGDLKAREDPVHGLETDDQTRRVFEHASMLGQRGIGMGFQLLQELCLVEGRHPAVTARGLDSNVQGAVVMPCHIAFDRVDMHSEVTRRFLWCRSRKD